MGVLDGRVAIVTGGGRGVGRCHAEALAAAGAAVVVSDLGEGAPDTVADIAARGGKASPFVGSVTSWEAAEALVRTAIDTYGDIDIVVNNAGFIRDAPMFAMEEATFDAVTEVHLKGHFAVSRFACAHWRAVAKAAGEGAALRPRRIVNTTSESGLFGGPAQINYGAAKGGIVSMTLIEAREMGRYNVTANCIAPRARTPMTEFIPKFAKPAEGFDRYDPANVSPTVVWLASDLASGVNGQVFIVLGDQIHRVQPATIANSIVNGGHPWTAEQIAERMADLFGPEGPGVPAWAGPPM